MTEERSELADVGSLGLIREHASAADTLRLELIVFTALLLITVARRQ